MGIYISKNGGVSGTINDFNPFLDEIAISADGKRLAVTSFRDPIYISSDGGTSWIESYGTGPQSWNSIASSADGTKLIAAAGMGGDEHAIFTSSNGGVNWIKRSVADGPHWWGSVVSSASGAKLALVDVLGPRGKIYTSTDSGVTWNKQVTLDAAVDGITSSADGKKLAAVTRNNDSADIYTSTDSGVTWNKQATLEMPFPKQITSSADGSKLAVAGDESIYTSIDSGTSWVKLINFNYAKVKANIKMSQIVKNDSTLSTVDIGGIILIVSVIVVGILFVILRQKSRTNATDE
jgi:photosystem II stability/assembly factor-like uncharacterized protein